MILTLGRCRALPLIGIRSVLIGSCHRDGTVSVRRSEGCGSGERHGRRVRGAIRDRGWCLVYRERYGGESKGEGPKGTADELRKAPGGS